MRETALIWVKQQDISPILKTPDGTLIEFVETHKVPVLKKLGWYLDLRKRDPKKVSA